MAKQTISTDELILKLVDTADEYGVVDKPYSGVYGRMLKERVRYKDNPLAFIITRAKELTGKDVYIYTQKNQLELYRLQLEQMGLVKDVNGEHCVDGRELLGETKVAGESEVDVFRCRKLYDKIKEYSKSHKMTIDDVFSKMGLTYIRMRGPVYTSVTEEEIINLIASYADENNNVDRLKKDDRAIHKIRDWLRAHNYECKNDNVVSILSDFMIERCPQYYFSTTLMKIDETIHTYVYKKLITMYPKNDKGKYIITDLKSTDSSIYMTLSRLKTEMPQANEMSMKEFIEDMYEEFIYVSDVTETQSRQNERMVIDELRVAYGAPKKDAPMEERILITDLGKDSRLYSAVYKFACKHMMSVREYLESLGYAYVDLKQKFDSNKHHLVYMDTDEIYSRLNKEVPENMRRHFEMLRAGSKEVQEESTPM